MPLKGAEREHFLSIRKFSFKKANTIFSLGISFWWLKLAQIRFDSFHPTATWLTSSRPHWPPQYSESRARAPGIKRSCGVSAPTYKNHKARGVGMGESSESSMAMENSTKILLFLDVFPLQNPWVSLFHCHIYLCSLKRYANQKNPWHAPFKRLAVRMIYEYLECII